jgi:hypothetical protein
LSIFQDAKHKKVSDKIDFTCGGDIKIVEETPSATVMSTKQKFTHLEDMIKDMQQNQENSDKIIKHMQQNQENSDKIIKHMQLNQKNSDEEIVNMKRDIQKLRNTTGFPFIKNVAMHVLHFFVEIQPRDYNSSGCFNRLDEHKKSIVRDALRRKRGDFYTYDRFVELANGVVDCRNLSIHYSDLNHLRAGIDDAKDLLQGMSRLDRNQLRDEELVLTIANDLLYVSRSHKRYRSY